MLLTITYYAQYYAQEQELLSDYYALYAILHKQFTACSRQTILKTVLLECINERYLSIPLCSITQ